MREEFTEKYFQAVVGNPPYQQQQGEAWSAATYHTYVLIAQEITSCFVSMIYPARWRMGAIGPTMNAFKESQMKSKNYAFYKTFGGKIVFPEARTGLLNVILWDRRSTYAFLREQVSEVEEIYAIIAEKVPKPVQSMADLIQGQTFYGPHTDSLAEVKKFASDSGTLTFIYSSAQGLERMTVDKSITSKPTDNFKTFLSRKANRNKHVLIRHDRIFIGLPGEIRGRFLLHADFATEEEARHCALYLKTNFVNFLLGIYTPATDVAPIRYACVPALDFATGQFLDNAKQFLDFTKPSTLDAQLASIYNLTEEEQNLMASVIRPWQDKTAITEHIA